MNARRTIGILIAVCFVLASGWVWYAAAEARTPAQRAQRATVPPPSVVTAPVQAGPLVDSLELDGVVSRASVLTVSGGAAGRNVLKQVVTAVPVKAGESIHNGQVIAEVSGRPVIALDGAFPAYRDLGRGATGPDVRQLQRALRSRYGTPVTGILDARTEADVRRLYHARGYDLPENESESTPEAPSPSPSPSAPATVASTFLLPAGELAFVADLPAVIGAVPAKVGGNGTGPLVTLASGGWRLRVPLSSDAERKVQEAQNDATYRLAGAGDVRVRFQKLQAGAADQNGESRRTAVFSLSDGSDLRLGATMPLRMEVDRSPAGAVVVPASALWTAADGTVSVSVVAATGPARDVAVKVSTSVDGRAAVVPAGGALKAGDRVAVADRDARPTGG